jgi:hypothetical protein
MRPTPKLEENTAARLNLCDTVAAAISPMGVVEGMGP